MPIRVGLNQRFLADQIKCKFIKLNAGTDADIVRVLSSLSLCSGLVTHSRQYIFERTSKGARSLHFDGSQGCGKAQ